MRTDDLGLSEMGKKQPVGCCILARCIMTNEFRVCIYHASN